MKFEFYVLNYDFNRQQVVMFNIFNNILVQEYAEKTVRKYLRAPNKFEYHRHDEEPLKGFEGFAAEILSIIMWQEWSRIQYEISVGYAFEDDVKKLEKLDCYEQCKPNKYIIAHEVIRQYKEQLKEKKNA